MSGLTKYEKETIILTNEADEFYDVYTFNSALKKKLAAYAKRHPDLCSLTETTREGSVTYKVDKTRLSIRLSEPYSEERRKASSERAKKQGLGKPRIMQRVGRINRVGTEFDRIYVFNFFPTAQSHAQVPMHYLNQKDDSLQLNHPDQFYTAHQR